MTRRNLSKQAEELGVEFVPWGKAGALRIIPLFCERFDRWRDFSKTWWLTFGTTIYHPDAVTDPLAHTDTVAHELVHVIQQAKTWVWWWIARYLASWRYVWRMEREAYLVNIKHHGYTIVSVVNKLRYGYGIKLEPRAMENWFRNKLEKSGGAL